MKILTIPQKRNNTGSIHDIESGLFDRNIIFASGCKYAVIKAAFYGGKGYTTHKSDMTTIKAIQSIKNFSHQIIGVDGTRYTILEGWHPRLVEL